MSPYAHGGYSNHMTHSSSGGNTHQHGAGQHSHGSSGMYGYQTHGGDPNQGGGGTGAATMTTSDGRYVNVNGRNGSNANGTNQGNAGGATVTDQYGTVLPVDVQNAYVLVPTSQQQQQQQQQSQQQQQQPQYVYSSATGQQYTPYYPGLCFILLDI